LIRRFLLFAPQKKETQYRQSCEHGPHCLHIIASNIKNASSGLLQAWVMNLNQQKSFAFIRYEHTWVWVYTSRLDWMIEYPTSYIHPSSFIK